MCLGLVMLFVMCDHKKQTSRFSKSWNLKQITCAHVCLWLPTAYMHVSIYTKAHLCLLSKQNEGVFDTSWQLQLGPQGSRHTGIWPLTSSPYSGTRLGMRHRRISTLRKWTESFHVRKVFNTLTGVWIFKTHLQGLEPSAISSILSELMLVSVWSLWAIKAQCRSLLFTQATLAVKTHAKSWTNVMWCFWRIFLADCLWWKSIWLQIRDG